MKYILALTMILAFSSCDKLKKMEEGMQATRDGMKATQEGLRKSQLNEAQKNMNAKENREMQSPIPIGLMSSARSFAAVILPSEMLLWTKAYMIKVNEETFADNYPWVDEGSEEGQVLKAKFMMNKQADLLMMIVVSGNLPESTLAEMIASESEQGGYKEVLFAILKMRADFYADAMLEAGMLASGKKLDTLGTIDNAIGYAEKLDSICKLEFTNLIMMKVTGFNEETNEKLSQPLDKDLALKKWKKILERAQNDFKAQSHSKDPARNEEQVKAYAAQHKAALEKIQAKIDAYSK